MTEYTPHPLVEDGYPMAPTIPDQPAGKVGAWLVDMLETLQASPVPERPATVVSDLLLLFRHANPDAQR